MPADLDAAREVLAKISRAEQYIALHPGGADLLGMMEDRDVGYGYLGIESAAWLDEIEQLRAERDSAHERRRCAEDVARQVSEDRDRYRDIAGRLAEAIERYRDAVCQDDAKEITQLLVEFAAMKQKDGQ